MAQDKAKLKNITRCLNLLEKRLVTILQDQEQFNRYIVTTKEGTNSYCKEEVFQKVDDKALKNAVGILKDMVEVRKAIVNLTEPQQATSQDTGVILIAKAECENSE